MPDGSPEKQTNRRPTKAERERDGEQRKLRLDVKKLVHTRAEADKYKIDRTAQQA